MPRNFAPKSQQQDERMVVRAQGDTGHENAIDFLAGVFNDHPNPPKNGLFYLENYLNKGKRLDPRGGTQIWSDTVLPIAVTSAGALRSGYTYSSTIAGTTRTLTVAAAPFLSTDVDYYFVFDNGTRERITGFTSTSVVSTYTSGTPTASGTAGYLVAPSRCQYFHEGKKKWLCQLGTEVKIASTLALAAWNRAFCISYKEPTNVYSQMDELKSDGFLINSNGIFRIEDVTSSPLLFYKANSPCPSVKITDENVSANEKPTLGYYYGHKYLITMSRLSGTGLRQRTTSGVVVRQESPPTIVDSENKDYGLVYSPKPIGDENTSYGVLTGGTLGASYDTAAEWAALGPNCQFTITINGTTQVVVCDFVGCLTMAEVAARIQIGLRAVFTTATYASTAQCDYVTNHFVITSPDEGGSVTVTSASGSGTDIGATAMSCQVGTGTVTTPTFTQDNVIGTLTCPVDPVALVPEYHWTHYTLWRTKDIGEFGLNAATGVANNPNLFVWAYDVNIARAFTASEAVTTHLITLAAGQVFDQSDVGSTLTYLDGSTSVIQYLCNAAGTQVYTQTSQYAIGNHADAVASQSAALGGGTVITASQAAFAGTIGAGKVTATGSTPFAAGDVRKTIYWADGTESHIVRFLTTTTVEVAESTTIASQAATFGPVSRMYNDIIADNILGARESNFVLQNRIWEPLPESNIGKVTPSFMFVGSTAGNTVSYSQIAEGYESLIGYHNPNLQVTTVRDSLQDIFELPDSLVIFCEGSTWEIPLSSIGTQTIESIGSVVAYVTSIICRDTKIGAFYGCFTHKDIGTLIGITSEPAVREYNGRQYSPNLWEDRMMTKLRALQQTYAVSYDPQNGLMFWGLS